MTEQIDAIYQYFKNISELVEEVPREKMFELWRKAKKGDHKAKKRLLELNLRLVVPTAKKYYRPGIDLMDLIEEGNLGLLHAIDKFEPKKGYRFSTYALYWVEQNIRRAVEQQGGTIRIPSHAWENLRKWLKQWDRLHGQLGRDPTLSEMAQEMQWSARQIKSVIEASEAMRGVGSLATPIGSADSQLTIGDTIVDLEKYMPDKVMSDTNMKDDFKKALNEIGDREKLILELRYGLNGKKPVTLQGVGKKLKLSRERVRQLEDRAVLRLRRAAHRLGLIELESFKVFKTPNITPGKLMKKAPTNMLGQPAKAHPLRKKRKYTKSAVNVKVKKIKTKKAIKSKKKTTAKRKKK